MSTLTDYAVEFQELLDDCKRAKPNPIIHNPEQKFNTYIRGLRRANMHEKHIDTVIAMKIYDWEKVHEFLVYHESATSKHIRDKYDSGKPQL